MSRDYTVATTDITTYVIYRIDLICMLGIINTSMLRFGIVLAMQNCYKEKNIAAI